MTMPSSRRNSEFYPSLSASFSPSKNTANTSHHKEIFSSRLLILFSVIILVFSPCFYVYEPATCEWKSVIALMMISWIFSDFLFPLPMLCCKVFHHHRVCSLPFFFFDYVDVSCCVQRVHLSSPLARCRCDFSSLVRVLIR